MARRRGSRTTALAFLLIALLAAGVFALLFVTTVQGLQAELDEASVEEETQQVVVASRELTQGETLSELDVEILEIPETFIPDGIFQYPEDVIGRVPRERILPGEFIREDRLADAESGVGLNAIIPRGKRAVSININDGSAVSGFLNPGNYVDVIVTILADDRTEKTRTLLQATRVLAVNNRLGGAGSERNGDGRTYKPSVTLAVTPEQAALLAHSQIEGDVTLTLRNDIDVTHVETHGTDARQLIGGDRQVALDTIAPTPRPAPVTREREEPRELLIIRGSDRETRDPTPGRGRRSGRR